MEKPGHKDPIIQWSQPGTHLRSEGQVHIQKGVQFPFFFSSGFLSVEGRSGGALELSSFSTISVMSCAPESYKTMPVLLNPSAALSSTKENPDALAWLATALRIS